MNVLKQTIVKDVITKKDKLLAVIFGTSAEEKPLTYAGGSVFIETDHSDGAVTYMFDEASMSWVVQPK